MHLDYRRDLDEELTRRAESSPAKKPLPLTLSPDRERVWLSRPKTHIPWAAVVLSASAHAMFFFGLPQKSEPDRKPLVPDYIEVNLPDIPEVEEEPEEIVTSDDAVATEDLAAMAVPSLADIPTTVPINAFVQHVTLADMKPPTLDVPATVTIPPAYRRGPMVTSESLKEIFSLAELDRVPEARVRVPPQYPFAKRRLGLPPVKVTVRFVVNTNGDVVDAQVVSASHDGFEDAALTAILRWKFRPGMRRGKVVNTRMEQPLIFTVIDD